MCDMTHSYVGKDSCMCVTRLIYACDLTHSYVGDDSFTCARREFVTSSNGNLFARAKGWGINNNV